MYDGRTPSDDNNSNGLWPSELIFGISFIISDLKKKIIICVHGDRSENKVQKAFT
jgi:hypothetical protein